MKVEIYTKDNCVWCTRAKNLMSDLQISYLEHDLSDDDDLSDGENSLTV